MFKFFTAVVIGFAWINACTAMPLATGPTDAAAGNVLQARETARGRFVIVFGDPPPDSGRPAQRRYSLTEQNGRRWTLVFDETVYVPPGGIEPYNGKDVEVRGSVTGTDRMLVESIRIL